MTEYRPLEIYTFLILECLVLILIVSAGVRWLERRMQTEEHCPSETLKPGRSRHLVRHKDPELLDQGLGGHLDQPSPMLRFGKL